MSEPSTSRAMPADVRADTTPAELMPAIVKAIRDRIVCEVCFEPAASIVFRRNPTGQLVAATVCERDQGLFPVGDYERIPIQTAMDALVWCVGIATL